MTQLDLARADGTVAATIPTPPMADEKPDYKVYRSRPRLLARARRDGRAARAPRSCATADPRRREAPPRPAPRRAGRRGPRRPGARRAAAAAAPLAPAAPHARPRARWLAARAGRLDRALGGALHGLRPDPARRPRDAGRARSSTPARARSSAPNTILVLGSDARTKGLGGARLADRRPEPLGLDHAPAHRRRRERLALDPARHGRRHPRPRPRQDQRRLRVRRPARWPSQTVKQFLGIDDQPRRRGQLRRTSRSSSTRSAASPTRAAACVSKINGGRRNGGTRCACTRGETRAQRQAGARARAHAQERLPTRARTTCTRARRQQQLVAAMKDKVTSFETFVRLPWVSWAAPQGDPLRHGRPDAARRRRRLDDSAATAKHARAQALGRRHAARRRRRPDVDDATQPRPRWRASCAADPSAAGSRAGPHDASPGGCRRCSESEKPTRRTRTPPDRRRELLGRRAGRRGRRGRRPRVLLVGRLRVGLVAAGLVAGGLAEPPRACAWRCRSPCCRSRSP